MTLEYDLPSNFETLEELREWVWQQFQKTESEFNLGREAFYVKDSHAEPPKPRNGMIVRADGTNWNPDPTVNPGNEPGYWGYEDSQWILISRTGAALDPDIPNNFVTNAMLADMAQARVKGRAGGAGTGAPQDLTLTQVLDMVGSAAQGDILYRGASDWARLGAGTSGQFLQTFGSGQNVQWGSAVGNLLASGSVSNVATLDFVLTSYVGLYRSFALIGDFLPATDGVAFRCLFSTNGGSSYDAGASDYSYVQHFAIDDGTSGTTGAAAAAFIRLIGTLGNATQEGIRVDFTLISPFSTSLASVIMGMITSRSSAATSQTVISRIAGCREAAQDTDAMRFLFDSGNIAAANYALYGFK